MPMPDFTISPINLTVKDPLTDQLLTANVYTVEGVNNNQPISIGGLVMALCLARATELEKAIIEIMDDMEKNSATLERLTKIEENLIAGKGVNTLGDIAQNDIDRLSAAGIDVFSFSTIGELYDHIYGLWKYQLPGDANYAFYESLLNQYGKIPRDDAVLDHISDRVFLDSVGITSTDADKLISDIEAKMDSLNSFSQQIMIELQSQTNKRDQAYDMAANILKSLNTVLVGIANNM